LEVYGTDVIWHPVWETRVLVSAISFIFLLVTLFGIFILIKYLIIRSQCKRVHMVIFYLITIANLIVRLAIMVTLNFRTFFATTNLILSVASLMFALLTGTSHTKILMTLVIDLKTLKCIND